MNIKNLYKQILSEFDDKMTGYPTQDNSKSSFEGVLQKHGYSQDQSSPQHWYITNPQGIVTHHVHNRTYFGPNKGNPKYKINVYHDDGTGFQREADTIGELDSHLNDIHK